MKKVTLPKQGSVSVKLRKQKRNRKVLVLPKKRTTNKIKAQSRPKHVNITYLILIFRLGEYNTPGLSGF